MKVYVVLVLFSIHSNLLKTNLVQKSKGRWMLPFKDATIKNNLEDTAYSMVNDILGHYGGQSSYIEQLYTFDLEKDKSELMVSYFILLPSSAFVKNGTAGVENWFNMDNLPKLSSTDVEILEYALRRLRWKLEYTNAAYSFLPVYFTLSELQMVYEVILGRTLDKRNFRKKMLGLSILSATGKKKSLGKARPAEMYKFKNRKLTYVEVL